MHARSSFALAVAGALAVVVAVLLAATVRPWGARVELGRGKPTTLSEAEARFLREHESDVTLTYFVSGDASMPSEMRGIERRVRAVLDPIASASGGRVEVRVVHAESSPELERYAASRAVAPFRRRSVVRDRFSETTVWSTLEIAAGPLPPVLLRSVGPEHLPHLRELVLTHLRLLAAPPRPRVAFAAPEGYTQLEEMFASAADVLRVDLDRGERLPPDLDLVVWLEPRESSARVREELEARREDGTSLWIAGSQWESDLDVDDAGEPRVALERSGLDARELWSQWGLAPLGRVLLDDRSHALPVDGERFLPLPYVVRCTGHNQDFRGFVDQPAGSLLFAAPTAFALDADALAARRLSAKVIATSSEATRTLDIAVGPPGAPTATPLRELGREGAQPLAKQPLVVMLEPDDPWQGAVVAFGASTPFGDDAFDLPGYEHRRMAQIVAMELLSNARLVARRTERHRAERLPEVSAAMRTGLRAGVLLGLPALLLLAAFARGEARLGDAARRLGRRTAIAAGGVALLALAGGGLAALARTAGVETDVSRGRVESLSPTTTDLGSRLARDGGLELVWYGSALSRMAPEQRAGARRALALFERFTRESGRGATFRRFDPDELPEAEALELARRGIEPFRVRSEDGERVTVRAVYATLLLRHGSREEQLAFPDAGAFEDTEFRLAFALTRLAGARAPRIALATDAPRLSPAEAHTEFQSRRRFAPSGTDVYSLARAVLERAGFDVVHVEPRLGVLPADTDAVVWLQPRRAIGRMLESLAYHLHGGGRALVAAQHFVIQPQQHEGREFRTVYWPQPQVPDIDAMWLPDIGVHLVREVLFDELSADVPLVTRVGSDPGSRAYDVQASALPFLVRATMAHAADDPVTAGIGDQVLPFASAVRLDRELLGELGLSADVLLTTSPRTWSFDWRGGFLPEDVLAGPPPRETGRSSPGRAPLLVRIRGTFPLPMEPLFERAESDPQPIVPEAGEGELLLLGGSELFKNERILDPRFRADRLLVNAVAHLVLEPAIAELAGRRAVPPGFGHVEPRERVFWRTLALAGGPLVAVLAAALRFALRRRRIAGGLA